jgi:antitoxin ParD1/3/4
MRARARYGTKEEQKRGGEYDDRMIDDTSSTLPVPIGTGANRVGFAQARALRAKAAKGGLVFAAYLPPRLAEWVLDLIESGEFANPSEAVFVILGEHRELEPHADLREELLLRSCQAESDDVRPLISGDELAAHFREPVETPLPEAAVWWKTPWTNDSSTLPVPIGAGGNRALSTLDHSPPSPRKKSGFRSRRAVGTRRAYRLDVQHFMRMLAITAPGELRRANHKAVIDLGADDGAGQVPERNGALNRFRPSSLLPFAQSAEERRPVWAWRRCSRATPSAISRPLLLIDRG